MRRHRFFCLPPTPPSFHSSLAKLTMARKSKAKKDAQAAEAAEVEAPANEGGDDQEPPAKKSKNQQHRKDKRVSPPQS